MGSWGVGPQNRVLRGSNANGNSRVPRAGLLEELAEAQWSRLAPMQAA